MYLAPTATARDRASAQLRDIYEQHFEYVWRTLRRLGIPAADLEDTVHDVFVIVHRRMDDYDPGRPLRPWLFGISYRAASDHRRRVRAVEVPARDDEVLALPDGTPSPEARLAAEQARARVHQALATLPLEQRAVIVMHDLEGHSAPEVAEALGVGLNTVYSRLRLGRQKFVTALHVLTGAIR